MKVQVKNSEGLAHGEIELSARVFGAVPNNALLYEAIKNQLANKRQGTVNTKTISEVRGSTKKPWRQKGTGNARAGTRRSPLWRGGAVIFGPKPRDYSYSLPKKMRQGALFSVLSLLCQKNKLSVIDEISLSEYSTKLMYAILQKLTRSKKVVFIIKKDGTPEYSYLRKSARNIPWLKVVHENALEIKDLFYADEVLVARSAADALSQRYKVKTSKTAPPLTPQANQAKSEDAGKK